MALLLDDLLEMTRVTQGKLELKKELVTLNYAVMQNGILALSGLALVKGITDLHGGTIDVKSDGFGRGSEFTLHLSTAVAPESAAISCFAANASL
jgi:K+-sensing histidine kinase KdpD